MNGNEITKQRPPSVGRLSHRLSASALVLIPAVRLSIFEH